MFNKKEIEQLQRDIEWLSEAISKTDNLYQYDNHETKRPKVDILSDSFSNTLTNVWNRIANLAERIEKLEVKEGKK